MYLATVPQTKFAIFLDWLRDVGGKYQTLHDTDGPNPKRANYEPAYKPTLKPLNPKLYRVDGNGSVRKISEKALELAEKMGI